MNDILNKIVDKIFDKIPFSKKSEVLKENINDKIIKKYNESKDKSETKKLATLLNKCNSIKNTCMELSIDYDEYTISPENQIGNKLAHSNLKSIRKYIIIKSVFISFIINNIISSVCNFNIYSLISNIVAILIDLLIISFINKRENQKIDDIKFESLKYNSSGKKYILSSYDKYSKKLLNYLMLDIAVVSYFVSFILMSILISKYGFNDITSQLNSISTIIFMLSILTFKNYSLHNLISVYFTEKKHNKFNKYTIKFIKFSLIYFLISLILMILLRNIFTNIMNLFFVIGVIYFIICLIFNLTSRKEIVFDNICINGKKIITVTFIILIVLGYNVMNMDLFLTQPFINSVSDQLENKDIITYNDNDGVYTITTDKDNFKILQLTDIHLGGSLFSYRKDIKALKACLKLIEATKPDLVVVTGDLVFPMGIMSLSLNNNAPVMQFASFMRNTGIPWAFTYGNHDIESMSKLSDNDFNELMKTLSYKTSHNLMYPYVQPDIYGRNNQRIDIKSSDGKIIQEIFLLDSNDYIEGSMKINEYDYIHDDQVEWYKENLLQIEKNEGYMPKSMIFFHIPLKDYKYINDLYESGSDEVKYYYGVLGEKMIDKICTSKHDSKLFQVSVSLKSTQAMFFGHDHYNNQSLEYKGIRMTYGYSIDYLVMPGIEEQTEQRGGTLIIINNDGNYEIKPYRLIDIK